MLQSVGFKSKLIITKISPIGNLLHVTSRLLTLYVLFYIHIMKLTNIDLFKNHNKQFLYQEMNNLNVNIESVSIF